MAGYILWVCFKRRAKRICCLKGWFRADESSFAKHGSESILDNFNHNLAIPEMIKHGHSQGTRFVALKASGLSVQEKSIFCLSMKGLD